MQPTDFVIDRDLALVQVDAMPLKTGQLAPSHAGVGGRDDQRGVGRRHSSSQGVDLGGARVWPLGLIADVDPQFPAGVRSDQPLVDCRLFSTNLAVVGRFPGDTPG